MKNVSKFIGIAFLAFTAFSCSSDDETGTPQLETIAEIAQQNPDLSILVDALVRTNLVDTFNGTGSFTVFAPTNTAFETFLATTPFETVDDVPVDVLTEILKNHVLVGSFNSTELVTGYKSTLAKGSASATNTLSMYFDVSSAGVFINGGTSNGGASVSTANIQASNGVIHVVNAVIGLPTIVNHAIANPNFSLLVDTLTGAGQPDFVSILSGTGPFTVFAPNNTAFTNLGPELVGLGITPTTAQITSVLQYHVANGNVLSTTLMNGDVITSLLGQDFTINLTGGGVTITDANARITNIIATDVQCSNGVIHVVNKVLLPSL